MSLIRLYMINDMMSKFGGASKYKSNLPYTVYYNF